MCRIGKTKNSATGRIKSQKGYYPFELIVTRIFFIDHDHAEKHFHRVFKPLTVRADWYRIAPEDFEREVERYKIETNQVIESRPVGIVINGSVKFWRVLSDKIEYKCDFVHINFDRYLLKLKCKDKVVNIKLEDDLSYNKAKSGNWVKGCASRNNSIKFIQVRFI